MAIQMSKVARDRMERSKDLMAGYARSIGVLCMQWANLDEAIDHLLVPLLNSDPEITACITASIDKITPRLDIVKRAAVHSGLSEEWISWLNGIAYRIDNEFRQQRNQYVHDCARLQFVHDRASPEDWEFVRVGRKAKIGRPQSRQPEQLLLKPQTKVSTDDIDRLSVCIGSVTFAIGVATHELTQWRLHGHAPFFRQEIKQAVDKGAHLEKIPFFVLLASEPLNINFITD